MATLPAGLGVLRRATRRLRHVPGTGRFLERLRQRHHDTNIYVVDDIAGDLRMELDLNEHVDGQIFWYGTYSGDVLTVLVRLLRPGMTVLDIGAHIGEVTLVAARQVTATGKVFAFEPVPSTARRLRTNIALNGFTHVEVIEQGISDHGGRQMMFDPTTGGDNLGAATLYPGDDAPQPLEEVALARLDAWHRRAGCPRIDFVKIDVEGGAMDVLSGARNLLKTCRPTMIIEVDRKNAFRAGHTVGAVYALLRELDYEMFVIDQNGALRPLVTRQDEPGTANVLAIPTEP